MARVRTPGLGRRLLPLTLVALASWGLAQSPTLAADDQLTVEYSFERPQITEVTIERQVYHRISMPDCPNGGEPGHPALPASGARILLPSGTAVASIEIVPGARIRLGGDYLVEPIGTPFKLSEGPDSVTPPERDSAVYALDSALPAARFERVGTYAFRGYELLVLKLQPVQYVPASGELYYYSSLTVVVGTVAAEPNPLFRGLVRDEREVCAKVDNPQMVESYATAERDGRGFDLLILTTPGLADAFTPLLNYHNANGTLTEIRTTTDAGGADPDTVRAYITDCYNNDGISYAIIGGDDDILPAKNLYVQAYPGGTTETTMPGDLYVGCLDGTWNYDGDGYWGEPTDGPGGGDVDLIAEVYIGRACGGNTTEINRFVTKTLWYLNGQHSTVENVLLVGEYLGFGGVSDYAADTLEQLIDGSSADNYTTVGIPSDVYTIDELFERDMNWNQSHLVTRINNGVHLLDHLGHGAPSYAMKLNSSDILSTLDNTDLCFVYSQTCDAGHFDGTDCWAEYMNIKTDHGGFGVVMNARSGWGQYDSTDGPSQRFNREYWDAVYGESIMEMGRANQDSKEDNLYRINDSCGRWCYYELNLFGDPTVAFQGVDGFRIDPDPALHELCIPADDEAVYTIEVDQLGDFVEVITLTADGVPAGASVDFSVNSVPPPFTTVMTVGNLAGAAADEYDVAITGTSATLQRAALVGLHIADGAPEQVTLSSPDNGETGVLLLVELSWEPAAQAGDYGLEVATDAAFTNVVYSATTAETSHTPDTALDTLTHYYWHVRATNTCGDGDYADAFGFVTVNMVRPISYDLLNGEDGTYSYYDDSYDGDGDNSQPLAPLARGLGDLTDGVIATSHWNSTPDPYVGWVTIDPTITFHFSGVVNISTVVLHLDDDGGGGGVHVPDDVTVSMGGTTLEFTCSDPPGGEPFAFELTDLGLSGSTLALTIADHSTSGYMMLSEVEFYSDEQPCIGDLDGDHDIDLADLAIMLAGYGMTDPHFEDGDLDGDGDVDLTDLSLLLGVYGTTCP